MTQQSYSPQKTACIETSGSKRHKQEIAILFLKATHKGIIRISMRDDDIGCLAVRSSLDEFCKSSSIVSSKVF